MGFFAWALVRPGKNPTEPLFQGKDPTERLFKEPLMTWNHGYDTDLGYTYGYCREQSPVWIDLCAALHGSRPPCRAGGARARRAMPRPPLRDNVVAAEISQGSDP